MSPIMRYIMKPSCTKNIFSRTHLCFNDSIQPTPSLAISISMINVLMATT